MNGKRRCVCGGKGRRIKSKNVRSDRSLHLLQGLQQNKEHLSWQHLTGATINTRLRVRERAGIMFITLLFIICMSEPICLYDRSLAPEHDPLFNPWMITAVSPSEHLGSSFQRERNNNPLYDVFHMRSMMRTCFFYFYYSVLHRMCWRSGKKEREEKKRQGRRKVSGREEKVSAEA